MKHAAFRLRTLVADDYDRVYALWKNTEGVGLSSSDSREGIEFFLKRNPGLSRVAVDSEERLLGTLLCGHDGRRGYLHHLAVIASARRAGIGRALVEAALADLRKLGIAKCNLFLIADNETGRAYWNHIGWKFRTDLVVVQAEL